MIHVNVDLCEYIIILLLTYFFSKSTRHAVCLALEQQNYYTIDAMYCFYKTIYIDISYTVYLSQFRKIYEQWKQFSKIIWSLLLIITLSLHNLLLQRKLKINFQMVCNRKFWNAHHFKEIISIFIMSQSEIKLKYI